MGGYLWKLQLVTGIRLFPVFFLGKDLSWIFLLCFLVEIPDFAQEIYSLSF
jgi:hypothetical protein